jgi:hypothetical protein
VRGGDHARPAAPQLERGPCRADRGRRERERAGTGRLPGRDRERDGDVVDRPDPVDASVGAKRRDLAQGVEAGRAETAEDAVRAGDVPRDRLVAELAREEVRLEHVAVGVRHEPARQVEGDALGQTDLLRGLPGREVEREQSPAVLVGADDEPRVGPARQQLERVGREAVGRGVLGGEPFPVGRQRPPVSSTRTRWPSSAGVVASAVATTTPPSVSTYARSIDWKRGSPPGRATSPTTDPSEASSASSRRSGPGPSASTRT